MITIYDSLKALRKDNIELLDDSLELDSDNYLNLLISTAPLTDEVERNFVKCPKLVPNDKTIDFIKKNSNYHEIVEDYLTAEFNKYDIQSCLRAITLANKFKNVRIVFHEVDSLYINYIKDFLVESVDDVKSFSMDEDEELHDRLTGDDGENDAGNSDEDLNVSDDGDGWF